MGTASLWYNNGILVTGGTAGHQVQTLSMPGEGMSICITILLLLINCLSKVRYCLIHEEKVNPTLFCGKLIPFGTFQNDSWYKQM